VKKKESKRKLLTIFRYRDGLTVSFHNTQSSQSMSNPNDKLEENNEQSLEYIDDEDDDDSRSNDLEPFNENFSLYERSMNNTFNV
jgi:hypothetical protein